MSPPAISFSLRISAPNFNIAGTITARNDTIVPEIRSAPVREAAANLQADYTIEAVGHNDIYGNPKFAAALKDSVDAVVRD